MQVFSAPKKAKCVKNSFLIINMKTFKLTLLLILTTVLMFSCKKENQLAVPTNQVETSSIQIDVPRTIVDGRLTFASLEDLRAYYFAMETLLAEGGDEEAIFSTLEEGYISLRSILEKRPVLNSDSRNNTSPDFILDDLRESMLNEHYEVGVENDVYVYLSVNQLVKVTCSNDVEKLRQATKGQTLQENARLYSPYVELIDNQNGKAVTKSSATSSLTQDFVAFDACNSQSYSDTAGETDAGIEEEIGTEQTETETGTEQTEDIYVHQMGFNFNNINCEIFTKEFSGYLDRLLVHYDENGNLDLSNDFEPYQGDFTLDYGDGTSDTWTNKDAIYSSHTYGSTGTYTATLSVTYFDEGSGTFGVLVENVTIIVEFACTENDYTKSTLRKDEANDRAMRCEIWFLNGILGSKAGAKTTGYRDMDDLEKEKGNIISRIDADFLDDNCSSRNYKWDVSSCNNCKSKSTQVTDLFDRRDAGDDSIFSAHEFKDNGAHITHQLILNPCQ